MIASCQTGGAKAKNGGAIVPPAPK